MVIGNATVFPGKPDVLPARPCARRMNGASTRKGCVTAFWPADLPAMDPAE